MEIGRGGCVDPFSEWSMDDLWVFQKENERYRLRECGPLSFYLSDWMEISAVTIAQALRITHGGLPIGH